MDLSATAGAGVRWRRSRLSWCLALLCLTAVPTARAQQVHVLIITGLAGEPLYRTRFLATAATLADSAKKRWGVADSSLIVLGEDPSLDPAHTRARSTREEVAQAFLRLSRRVAPGDIVLVFLN